MDTLTCGHPPTPAKAGSPIVSLGYGEDAEGRRYCYACCGVRDEAEMLETGKATLYLTILRETPQPGFPYSPIVATLTNWPGTLSIPLYRVKKGRHNRAGTRYDVWFSFKGQEWHGVQYGDNTQLCHCRRVKGG